MLFSAMLKVDFSVPNFSSKSVESSRSIFLSMFCLLDSKILYFCVSLLYISKWYAMFFVLIESAKLMHFRDIEWLEEFVSNVEFTWTRRTADTMPKIFLHLLFLREEIYYVLLWNSSHFSDFYIWNRICLENAPFGTRITEYWMNILTRLSNFPTVLSLWEFHSRDYWTGTYFYFFFFSTPGPAKAHEVFEYRTISETL